MPGDTSHPIAVVAAVIQRDGRYLVCQQPTHKHHGGLWEFPGGKVQHGECPRDALTRELNEELGLSALRTSSPRFSHADAGAGTLVTFHDVDILGEPELREHSQLGWFRVPDLLALPLAPSDAAYVRECLEV